MRSIAAAFWQIPARFLNEYVGINGNELHPYNFTFDDGFVVIYWLPFRRAVLIHKNVGI